MIHLLNFGARGRCRSRAPNPGQILDFVGTWTEVISKEERTVGAKFVKIAHPILTLSIVRRRLLRFELRVDGFKESRQGIINGKVMRRVAHIEFECHENAVPDMERIDRYGLVEIVEPLIGARNSEAAILPRHPCHRARQSFDPYLREKQFVLRIGQVKR